MTKALHIGKGLSLPPDTVTSTGVIYGGKGMGKTNLGSVLVEECARAGLRFSVIDPMGVWWGLRFDVSGKGPGIEVLILGGIHGDIPIEPTGGAVVADLVADEDVSVVIDVSRRPDGSMWSIAERIRFVTDYCKRLYQRQGERRRPLLQVIDEAARFAPQIVRHGEGEVAACMGAVAVLVEEGRNVGLGCWLITQRSARLNKDVAELADCMIAFRTVGPNSMGAVLDWLGEHIEKKRLKEISEKLRALPRGTALVVSPGWLEVEAVVQMRARQTFDSSATPKPGEAAKKVSGGAKPDLGKYAARMKETIERAQANDPRALQRKVAELQAQLKKLEATKAPKAKVETREVYVLKEGQLKRIEAAAERARQAGADFMQAAKTLAETIEPAMQPGLRAAPAPAPQFRTQSPPAPRGFTPPRAPAKPQRAHFDDPPPDGNQPLRPSVVRVLETIAAADGLTRNQVGVRAGYRPDAGSFGNYLYGLHGSGLIEKRDDRWFATDAGRAAVPHARKLTGPELQEKWRRDLRPSEWAILDQLLNAYPNTLTRAQLAEILGKRGDAGSFGNNIYKLTGGALAEKVGSGYRAAQDFFDGAA